LSRDENTPGQRPSTEGAKVAPTPDAKEQKGEDASLSYQPLSLNQPETALVRSLWWGNLITFAVLAACAAALVSWHSALSVVVGGLIALLNFRLLERTVGRTLKPQARTESPLRRVLTHYYLRFAATALVLLILVRQGLVEPLGLLAGLSVVVVSILVWGAAQARRFWNGR
jgi:hypothetical protein